MTWWEDELLQTISKSAEQTTKSRKLLHRKPQPIFSEASQERNGANHLTFQLDFPVFPGEW